MKKISIEVDEETHVELLKIQLEKRLKAGEKIPLAKVVAEYLRERLVNKENQEAK